MTFGEAKVVVTDFLKGDNSNPSVLPISLALAIEDVERHCFPESLTAVWDETKVDVFRKIRPIDVDAYGEDIPLYLKRPVPVTNDSDIIVIDPELEMAVVFFLCDYYTNKDNSEYRQKAVSICTAYSSNTIA
jgi:hypothetical protein